VLDMTSSEDCEQNEETDKTVSTGSATGPHNEVWDTAASRSRQHRSSELSSATNNDESPARRMRCCDRDECCMLDRIENEMASNLSWSTEMDLVDADIDEIGEKGVERTRRPSLNEQNNERSSGTLKATERLEKKSPMDVVHHNNTTGSDGHSDTLETSCSTLMTFATTTASDILNGKLCQKWISE